MTLKMDPHCVIPQQCFHSTVPVHEYQGNNDGSMIVVIVWSLLITLPFIIWYLIWRFGG